MAREKTSHANIIIAWAAYNPSAFIIFHPARNPKAPVKAKLTNAGLPLLLSVACNFLFFFQRSAHAKDADRRDGVRILSTGMGPNDIVVTRLRNGQHKHKWTT